MNNVVDIRVTKVYQYKPDFVKFGAVLIDSNTHFVTDTKHRCEIITRQSDLHLKPRTGQRWELTGDFEVSKETRGSIQIALLTFPYPKLI